MYSEVLLVTILGVLTITSFFNHNPEAYNALIRLFTNEGTPKSYGKLNYFGVNTYTFTKEHPVRAVPTLS